MAMVRKVFAILVIIVLFAFYYAYPLSSPEPHWVDFSAEDTSYRLEMEMVSAREFKVQEQVVVVNKGKKPLNVLRFQVFPKAFADPDTGPVNPENYPSGWSAGNIIVNDLKVDEKKGTPYFDGVLMSVPLEKPIQPGESRVVTINFLLKMPKLNYRFGSYDGIIALGDWYPVLVKEGRQITAYPPVGDPGIAPVADYQVEITVPEEYTVVTSGVLENERSSVTGRKTLLFKGDSLRNFAVVMGKKLQVKRTRVGNTEVEYAFINDRQVDTALATIKRCLIFYEAKFGQYPYPKLTVAETYLSPFQGVEYPGLLMLAHRVKENEDILQRVLAHEVAHQWWYAVVGNDQVREPWLDESLATYASKIFIEDVLKRQFNFGSSLHETARAGEIDFLSPVAEFASREEYLTHVYYGGTMFWTALEQQVGKERMFEFLRNIYEKYRFAEITTVQMQHEINRLVEQ